MTGEWIEVGERKPGDGEDVLACHAEDQWVDVLMWLEEAGQWMDPVDGEPVLAADAPTHWMALPEIPK